MHTQFLYDVTDWNALPADIEVYLVQKRVPRCKDRLTAAESCRTYFLKWNIMPLPAVHAYELLKYINQSKNRFKRNNEFHSYV